MKVLLKTLKGSLISFKNNDLDSTILKLLITSTTPRKETKRSIQTIERIKLLKCFTKLQHMVLNLLGVEFVNYSAFPIE